MTVVNCPLMALEHDVSKFLRFDAPRFAVADSYVVNDGVEGPEYVDLICHRTHLLQAGEIAGDDGFGPKKSAMGCFSALDTARM